MTQLLQNPNRLITLDAAAKIGAERGLMKPRRWWVAMARTGALESVKSLGRDMVRAKDVDALLARWLEAAE